MGKLTDQVAPLYRASMFKLDLTPAQEARFEQFAGVTRLVYNLALEQRREFWHHYLRTEGKNISFASQCREVTALRAEFPWIAAVSTDATRAALRDLERAYRDFFAGRRGYPTHRIKGVHDSFRLGGRAARVRQLNAKWSEILLPVLGWIKFRSTRPIAGDKLTITVSRRNGDWRMSVVCLVEHKATAPAAAVGVDRGVTNTIAMSTGELRQIPASISAIEARRRRAQRDLSGMTRGSNRYRRQREKVAGMAARGAAVRNDWLHRQTTGLAERFSIVALENLKIANMAASAAGTVETPGVGVTAKRGLNRAIMAQGWGIFAAQLAYKIEDRRGHLVFVSSAYTSQTCSACGTVDAKSRKSQAVFRCDCGHEEHADIGAAKEILRRSSAWLDVEGPHQRPDEASTRRASA